MKKLKLSLWTIIVLSLISVSAFADGDIHGGGKADPPPPCQAGCFSTPSTSDGSNVEGITEAVCEIFRELFG